MYDVKDYFAYLVWRGAFERFNHEMTDEKFAEVEHYADDDDIELHRRILLELEVINKAGFEEYFLIVWDLMRFCRESGIPVGPGRGSVCGSMVAYCLYITDVDPIRWGIPFERFLHLERIAMPDIDIDICQQRRGEVIQYMKDRYGDDYVAQIITYGTMQARGVVKDVCRVLHVDDYLLRKTGNTLGEKWASIIPEGSGADQVLLSEFIQEEEGRGLNEFLDTEILLVGQRRKVKLRDHILPLEGLRRHGSVHAAGIVIGNQPLIDVVPLYRKNQQADVQIQFDMRGAEDIGLLKLDALGLRTVTMLGDVERFVRRLNPDFTIKDVPLDDAATFEMLRRGDTKGVFQLEGEGMTRALVGLRADSFNDIVALLALYRPGPMEIIPNYVARKHGEEKVVYAHPSLRKILDRTYGLMVFQEQVMGIVREFGDYSPGEADMFRKAIGKKLPELIRAEIDRFVERAKKIGKAPPTLLDEIGEQIFSFGRYGFNLGHATGYAFITYWTAYAKANYPVEFYAATLNSFIGTTDRISMFVRDAHHHGIRIACPDINHSESGFSVHDDRILFGLAAIKGVGEKNVQDIVEFRDSTERNEYSRVRENRVKPDGTEYTASVQRIERVSNDPAPYADFVDFCHRLPHIPINVKKALITAGAFDSGDLKWRAQLLEVADEVNKTTKKKGPGGSIPIPMTYPSKIEMLRDEKESLGFYVTEHPLEMYRSDLDMRGAVIDGSYEELRSHAVIAGIVMKYRTHMSKRGEMAWVTIETGIHGMPEVTVFSDLWIPLKNALSGDDIVVFQIKKQTHPKFGDSAIAEEAHVFSRKLAVAKTVLVTIPHTDPLDLGDFKDHIVEEGAKIYLAVEGANRLALLKVQGYISLAGSSLKALQNQGWGVLLNFKTGDKMKFGGTIARKSKSMYRGSGDSRSATWELPIVKMAAQVLPGVKVIAEYET